MQKYKILEHIGDGAYGHVLKAFNRKDKTNVALKKILFKRTTETIPISVLREIKILLTVQHECIVKLLDYFMEDGNVVLVFDFMPSGLWEMIHDMDNPMSITTMKAYMRMLLRGVAYLHKRNIMHRDLKPANLLICKSGMLKIADLGLGRMLWDDEQQNRPYTHQVATRWYRAPELLYGSRHYNEAVDLWAVGCIFAEMVNKTPLFPGENDIEQLAIVLKKLGTPTESTWPGLKQLPDYNKISFPQTTATPFDVLIPDTDKNCVDLIKSFIVYDGNKRISAKRALVHKYFFQPPLATSDENMPRPAQNHRTIIRNKSRAKIDYDSMLDDLSSLLSEK